MAAPRSYVWKDSIEPLTLQAAHINFHNMQWKIIRCFVRPSRTYPLARQQALCEEAASQFGLDVVWYIQGQEAGDRDLWLRQVGKDEIAMVARLDMITGSRKEIGGRPIVDYAMSIASLVQRAGLVIEASTGARSDKPKVWKSRVDACAELIVQGRDLRPEQAREMARRSAAKRGPSIVKHWRDPSMQSEREASQRIWRDRALPNDVARFDALPDSARERLGSPATARKVLGRINPDKPTKAGRPPKIKPRKTRKP